jgi:hypothetical protein
MHNKVYNWRLAEQTCNDYYVEAPNFPQPNPPLQVPQLTPIYSYCNNMYVIRMSSAHILPHYFTWMHFTFFLFICIGHSRFDSSRLSRRFHANGVQKIVGQRRLIDGHWNTCQRARRWHGCRHERRPQPRTRRRNDALANGHRSSTIAAAVRWLVYEPAIRR